MTKPAAGAGTSGSAVASTGSPKRRIRSRGDRRGPGGRRLAAAAPGAEAFLTRSTRRTCSEPPGQQQGVGVSEPEDEEEAGPADVILLPGESLRK